ncbi:hypothetical protein NQ318_013751, partial [Aromia moschata]
MAESQIKLVANKIVSTIKENICKFPLARRNLRKVGDPEIVSKARRGGNPNSDPVVSAAYEQGYAQKNKTCFCASSCLCVIFLLFTTRLQTEGERPYVCNDCGKSYTTGSNLRSHTLSSHKEGKNHMCEICKMTFLYPRYLKLHMRKHTGERPYLCNVCDKKFVKKVHLT